MRATLQQPHRAPDGAPVHYERHRPEQTTLYRPVQPVIEEILMHLGLQARAPPWAPAPGQALQAA